MGYINLETAKLARIAGYNEVTSTVWFSDPEKLGEMVFSEHAMRCNHNAWVNEIDKQFPSYNAPTQEVLSTWIKRDFRLLVIPVFDGLIGKYFAKVYSSIVGQEGYEDLTPDELQDVKFHEREDAMEAALQFALNVVIERIDKSKRYLV